MEARDTFGYPPATRPPSAFLDPSDFPLLRPGAPTSASTSLSSTNNNNNNNLLPMSIVVGGGAQQQNPPKMYSDNFPALRDNSTAINRPASSASSSGAPSSTTTVAPTFNPFTHAAQQQHPTAATLQPSSSSSSTLQLPPLSYAASTGTAPAAPSSSSQFGLLGLMGVIRMEDADRGRLALGMDLTTLGLDLNSDECLYNVFAGPWDDDVAACASATSDSLLFHLPASYPKTAMPARAELFKDLSLDCLFAVFYSVIRDVLQLYAAHELTRRKWFFHIELKIWFTSQPNNTTANKTATSGNSIIFFDLGTWERKFYVGTRFQNGFLPENGFLAEDTIQQAAKAAQLALKPAKAWS